MKQNKKTKYILLLILFGALGFANQSFSEMRDTTIAHYLFNKMSGTIAPDHSGFGNDASFMGQPTWICEGCVQALQFAGNDFLLAKDHPSMVLDNAITVEAWVKIDQKSPEHQVFAAKWYVYETGPNTNNSFAFEILPNSQKLQFVLKLESGRTNVISTGDVPFNQWCYLVGVYNGEAAYVFINGQLDNSVTVTGDFITGEAPLTLGGHYLDRDRNYLFGALDQIRISNYALSAETITANYKAYMDHLAQNNRIIGHWTFDEGSGEFANDQSGNDNHFQLYNGVKWVKGLNGAALSFDGIDDKGLCPDKPCQTGMKAITIETVIWANRRPTERNWGPIIGKWGPGSSSDDAWALDIDRVAPHGGHGVVVSKSRTCHINGETPVPIEKWTHLVFTWNSLIAALYIDGVIVDSDETPRIGLIQDADTEIRLGHNVDPHFFDGLIDQITLYNYALDSRTILNNYKKLFNPVKVQYLNDQPKYSIKINNQGLVITSNNHPIIAEIFNMRGQVLYHNLFNGSRDKILIPTKSYGPGYIISRIKIGNEIIMQPLLIPNFNR